MCLLHPFSERRGVTSRAGKPKPAPPQRLPAEAPDANGGEERDRCSSLTFLGTGGSWLWAWKFEEEQGLLSQTAIKHTLTGGPFLHLQLGDRCDTPGSGPERGPGGQLWLSTCAT